MSQPDQKQEEASWDGVPAFFIKSLIASQIIKLIDASPMTERDKRNTHRQLMEALADADMLDFARQMEGVTNLDDVKVVAQSFFGGSYRAATARPGDDAGAGCGGTVNLFDFPLKVFAAATI